MTRLPFALIAVVMAAFAGCAETACPAPPDGGTTDCPPARGFSETVPSVGDPCDPPLLLCYALARVGSRECHGIRHHPASESFYCSDPATGAALPMVRWLPGTGEVVAYEVTRTLIVHCRDGVVVRFE